MVMLLLISSCVYSQEAEFMKGKNYKGFIFPKEHPISYLLSLLPFRSCLI